MTDRRSDDREIDVPDGGADVRAVASRFWPEWDWTAAHVTHGAFHKVALHPEGLVVRVAIGRDAAARTARERGILSALSRTTVSVPLPEPLDTPAAAIAAGASLVSRVSGRPGERADASSADGFAAYGAALRSLRDVPLPRLDELPVPRAWCGGPAWPSVVADRLVPRLPTSVRAFAQDVVGFVDGSAPTDLVLVHGDFGPHNMLWDGPRLSGLVDLDHACIGDPAIDIAPLVGIHGAAAAAQICTNEELSRAMQHRASLPLQVAAAADLAGLAGLRDHALRNFSQRVAEGTVFDPAGSRPRGSSLGSR